MKSPPAHLVEELSQLGYTLMRLLLTEAKEIFAQEGLSRLQAEVLKLVAEGINLPSRLAEHLEVQPSQISHLLASLEEAGLIERRLDPQDRRRVLLTLTENGVALQRRIEAAWHQVYGRRLSRLSPEELHAFRDVLRKLTEVDDA
ncbi:MarR family winged helix-turn-helix transcriptional regulator [Marinithermus hydrothermalis]|uniref:Regulatory protein MarR n=1 Tax=Marinithermus hydrothermalis (strain DSM 14884 / JCM 11576 / T1) TaxID=869210 RepID=F2NM98_MARHT|nr:MarR family transcriptional regulator [Marinithermus hydrothermalis]AEB11786.1 regulatory protein MarR [Marinithermus hydrothermalis DSM 14884]